VGFIQLRIRNSKGKEVPKLFNTEHIISVFESEDGHGSTLVLMPHSNESHVLDTYKRLVDLIGWKERPD